MRIKKNCSINCDFVSAIIIFLNQNRVGEFSRKNWGRILGHEQRHFLSHQEYLNTDLINKLHQENPMPCNSATAGRIQDKYRNIWREWKASGQNHVGDNNETLFSPIVNRLYDPRPGSNELPIPPGGWPEMPDGGWPIHEGVDYNHEGIDYN